mmetsp:Transcript_159/g.591  ORF Transcript_159/g.591 Transcript_159/m.591 type:complete len:381 (+) Transcript_159:140-1282(+)
MTFAGFGCCAKAGNEATGRIMRGCCCGSCAPPSGGNAEDLAGVTAGLRSWTSPCRPGRPLSPMLSITDTSGTSGSLGRSCLFSRRILSRSFSSRCTRSTASSYSRWKTVCSFKMSAKPSSSAICWTSLPMPFLFSFSINSFIFIWSSSNITFNFFISALSSSNLSPVKVVCVPCVFVLFLRASSARILSASSFSVAKRSWISSKSSCNFAISACCCAMLSRNSEFACLSASSSVAKSSNCCFCCSETSCRALCSSWSAECRCCNSSNSLRASAAAASASFLLASACSRASLASANSFFRPLAKASACARLYFKFSASNLKASCCFSALIRRSSAFSAFTSASSARKRALDKSVFACFKSSMVRSNSSASSASAGPPAPPP